MSFSLPPEISVQRLPLKNGMVYQFRHSTIGQLGRLVLQDRPNGLCHISSEVAGDPNDPMTETRAQIFEPLSQQLSTAVEAAIGKGARAGASSADTEVPPTSPKEKIACKQIPCPRCGEIAALLIFADQAREVGEMEDCARKMYHLL